MFKSGQKVKVKDDCDLTKYFFNFRRHSFINKTVTLKSKHDNSSAGNWWNIEESDDGWYEKDLECLEPRKPLTFKDMLNKIEE